MALRLAQRSEAADVALSEAAQMEARVRSESEAMRRFTEEETARMKLQNAGLSEQLADAVQAAAQLQVTLPPVGGGRIPNHGFGWAASGGSVGWAVMLLAGWTDSPS